MVSSGSVVRFGRGVHVIFYAEDFAGATAILTVGWSSNWRSVAHALKSSGLTRIICGDRRT